MKGFLLTHLLAYGGAAVALFNPFVGVCVYWILDIVRPQYMFAWSGTFGAFSQTVAVATLIGWAAKGFGNWSFGRGKLIVVFFFGSTVWMVISAVLAPDHEVAFTYASKDLKRVLMFIVCVTTADSIRRLLQLTWVLVGSAGYVAFELNMLYFRGSNEAQAYGYGGMDNNCLAISMVTCLGIAVFLALHVRPFWQKALAAAAALFIGHTVLLTFSRGGMLGMIVSGAVALAIIPKRPRMLIGVVGAIMLALTLAGPEVRARFMTSFAERDERDGAAQSRVQLWSDSLVVMGKYPIFGVGPNHFPVVVQEFGWPLGKEAHSLWLQYGAEIGVPGAVCLLLFYALSIRRLLPFARTAGKTELQQWTQTASCMVVSSLAGFMVSAQFVSLEGLETPLYVAAIAVGTLRLVTAAEASQPFAVQRIPAYSAPLVSAPAPSSALVRNRQ